MHSLLDRVSDAAVASKINDHYFVLDLAIKMLKMSLKPELNMYTNLLSAIVVIDSFIFHLDKMILQFLNKEGF